MTRGAGDERSGRIRFSGGGTRCGIDAAALRGARPHGRQRALVASLPIRATRIAARRHSTQLVRVSRQRHLTDVLELLADRGVEVLDIRTVDAAGAAVADSPPASTAGKSAAP